jgi:carbonic anhydrase
MIEEVSYLNVELSIKRIREKSFILREMENRGEIVIVGALYNVTDGVVNFI